ncbi:MAG TPA: kelch repeat-containing protein, partial [Pyrinomonadaceae bacterium]
MDNAKVNAIEVFSGTAPPPPSPTPTPTPSSTLTWTQVAPIPVARYESPATVAAGKVYVLGGFISDSLQATSRVDVYDPGSNTWARGTDMPVPLTHHAVAVDDQAIWIAGGFQGDFPGTGISNVWKYDVATGVWSEGPPLPGVRAGGAMVCVGRELHFFGGTLNDRHTDSADHWVLNLDNPVGWVNSTPMTSGRVHHSAAVVNGKIYLIGGGHNHDSFTDINTVEVYDPATGQWAARQSLSLARSHFEPGTFVVNERIIIAGGKGLSADQLSNVSEYNPATNTWRELTPLPGGLRAVVAQVVGNTIVTTGGGNNGGISPQTTTRTAILSDPPQLSPQALLSISPPDNGPNESGLNASTYNSGSFKITNNSQSGERITRVSIDLRGTILPDMVFDPSGTGGDPVGKTFTPDSDTGVVGLINHRFDGAHNGGYDLLEIDFSTFDPGETFTFSLDVDPNSIKGTNNNDGPSLSGKVSGLELTGARVTVEFSNGEVRVMETYRIPSSLSQSQNTGKAYTPAQPAISVLNVPSVPAKVTNASQTVRVAATAGSTVSLMVLEGGLYTDAGSGGGAGLPPFYANKAINVTEQTATVGSAGFVDIPVTLTRTDTTGGINHIVAVTKDSSGRTSPNSSVIVLEYDPNFNPQPTPTPTPTPGSGAFIEQGGQVVMEAENYDQQISRGGQSWTKVTDKAGYSGTGAMLSSPNTGAQVDTNYATTTPELQYKVNFITPGTYYLWLRAEADSLQDNSVHAGLDGQALSSADRMTLGTLGSFIWANSTSDGPVATLNVTSAGLHTVNIWMREDGIRIDRLLLTTSAGFTPTGTGPAESARSGANNPPPAPTGLTATPGFGNISLDWDDVSNATGYNVYRSTSSTVSTNGTPYNGTTPLTASSFIDTNASQSATYYYVVVAVNAAGTSAPTTPVSAKASGALPSCNSSANPRLLNFSGAVADTYAGSGFNCYMPGTVQPDAASTGLTLSGFNSQLTVTSTDGDIMQNATGQTNALALKFANSGSYSVRTRIKGPFSASGNFQSAGVALALDSNNYAKLTVGYANGAGRLQFGVETGGVFTNAVADVPFDLTELDSNTEALDLWLVRKSDGTIEALYRKVTSLTSSPTFGATISIGATASAPSWSASSSQLYGGLLTTDSGVATSFNTVYDEFELGAAVAAAPAPPIISFTNKTILKSGATSGTAYGISGFANPTSMAIGPDNRLYVATQLGQIYIVTLDQAKLAQSGQLAVISVQTLNQIASKPTRTCNINGQLSNCQFLSGTPTGRQVTGLVIAPESTPSNVVLYVSNSDPRIGQNSTDVAFQIDTYSGAITKLTLQPNSATTDQNDFSVTGNQDIVTGLPRSRENHSVNGMEF